MKLRRLDRTEFAEACARIDDGNSYRSDIKAVAMHLLSVLEDEAPGASVEVRVPPHAVAQCISGSHHTRGTPPAVVEMDAHTWIALARGQLSWQEAELSASGSRSDLSAYLPLV